MELKVIKDNGYNLPIGTILQDARRKDGDASPYPIVSGRFQFKDNEVKVLIKGACPDCDNLDIKQVTEDIIWCNNCGKHITK